MLIKFFTIHYNDEEDNFDDEEFQNFIKNKKIDSINEQFFIYKNSPCWGITIRYSSDKECKTKIKHNKNAYKEKLEKKDWPLFEALRKWRKDRADGSGLAVFIISDNITLATFLITLKPLSLKDYSLSLTRMTQSVQICTSTETVGMIFLVFFFFVILLIVEFFWHRFFLKITHTKKKSCLL